MLGTELDSQTTPLRGMEHAETQWYAAYTCPRHEKRVAERLNQNGTEFFLPLYQTVHRWKDRRMRVEMPLFPGYVFVHIALKDRLKVLQIPSVVRFVGFDGRPLPLPDTEIESLRRGLLRRLMAEPHPYLRIGRRVRVRSGPLAGAEGILVRKKGLLRVVLSIDAIMRSVAVEVEAADLEPIR